jgi:hypothetical protein
MTPVFLLAQWPRLGRCFALAVLLWGVWFGQSAQAFDHTHRRYARTLTRFVGSGRVNYVGLRAEPGELRAYLDDLALVTRTEFDGWTRAEQLALLLNLYNAATLQLVSDHYPVSSVRKIGGLFQSPWKLPVIRLWGQTHTLDWLENEFIRPRYQEPRVHFALVNAAKGCPPLRDEPYVAVRLEAQLDDQGRTFMAQRECNRFDGSKHTLYLSPIFKWYRDDFTASGKPLEQVVSPFCSASDARSMAESKVRIVFTTYDWSLNEARPAP